MIEGADDDALQGQLPPLLDLVGHVGHIPPQEARLQLPPRACKSGLSADAVFGRLGPIFLGGFKETKGKPSILGFQHLEANLHTNASCCSVLSSNCVERSIVKEKETMHLPSETCGDV